MEGYKTIKGGEIQNLITKFYYRENQLCFQILLHFGMDRTIPYKEFANYGEYKRVYAQLLEIKNSNEELQVPVTVKRNRTIKLA